MRSAPSFSIFQSGPIGFYRFPLPSEPAAYATYLLLRSSILRRQPAQTIRSKINRIIAAPGTRELYICSPQEAEGKSCFGNWTRVAHQELTALGLSWLQPPAHSLELHFKSMQGRADVELPFVPEFAHNLRRAKKLLQGKFHEIRPITAEFVPSLNCPFRCRQCSYKVQKVACGAWPFNDFREPSWQMDPDIVSPLVSRLGKAGVKYLVVTGGGEPLLNPRATLRALHEAKRCGMKTGLYTNGVCLTERRAAQILTEKPSFVRVSVNAGSDEVHTQYHMPLAGRPLFQRVMSGIKALAIQKARVGSATELGLSYIVNPVNYRDCGRFARCVAQIVEEVANGCINFVRFTPTLDYLADRQQSQEFFSTAVRLIKKDAIPILKGVGITPILYSHRFDHVEERKSYDECLGCSWFAEVAPDGSLYQCSEMNFFPAYRLGNLMEETLPSIWAGDRRRRVIEKVNTSRLRGCPLFCKPDTINRVAAKIREMCKSPAEKERVWQWLQDLHQLHSWQPDAPFAQPKTVAF